MSPTAEASVCLQDQGIDDNDGGVRRLIRAIGLSDNGRGVDRGRLIYNAYKRLETTTKSTGSR